MSTSTSPIFNGSSTFSSDFAQVISRAVSIASLPITQLNNQNNTLTGEQTALSALSTSFTSLQSSVAALSTAAEAGNYSASSSDNSVASAWASNSATVGTYSLEVDSLGSPSTAVSSATVTDPTTQNISTSTSYTLVANGQSYTIEPPPNANTLTSLVSAINTTTEGAVQATVINIGTTSQPQYELSLQSTEYGVDDVSLDDGLGSGNILNPATAGSPVQYDLNGQTGLISASPTLTLSPGLTATVLGEGTTNITVTQSTSNMANAISSFVKAYNATSAAVQGQRGTSGGALAGDGVVNLLSQSLQNLATYTGTGSIQSIADLGLTFDQSGVLSFDPTILSSVASSDAQGVTAFLGSATGGGFLEAATNTLNAVLDPTSGAIPAESNSVAGQILTTNNQINADQDRVDRLQTSLTNQMDAADAMIAEMQQQYSYLTGLFASMTSSQTTTG